MKLLKEDYSSDILKFLRKPAVQEAFTTGDINTLYTKLAYTMLPEREIGQLTSIIFKLGINPLNYLDSLPRCFLAGVKDIDSLVIPSNIKEIEASGLRGCHLKEIIFEPNSQVSHLPSDVFEWCEELEHIILPDHLRVIGDYAFAHCTNLTEIELPDTVTTIKEYAISHCKNLKTIKLNEGLIVIEESAFNDCGALEELVIPKSVTKLGD